MKKHTEAFAQLVADAGQQVEKISVAAVNALLSDETAEYFLVDVREDYEWEKGHVFAALHIAKGVLECDIERLIPDHGARIIVYCRGGMRSVLAAASLKKMGYTNVSSMEGGILAWVAADLEIDGEILTSEEQEALQTDDNEEHGFLS